MIDSFQKMTFDRRSALMIGGVGILTSILVLQMMNLQIFNKKKYTDMSKNNTYRVKIEIPRRGMIYDSNGEVLAQDEQVYRIYIIPKEVKKFQDMLDFLAKSLGLNAKSLARIKRDHKRQQSFQPILIREKLNWQKMAELSAMNLPGVHIEQGYTRRYPNGEMASHTIGYLSEPRDSVIPFFKTGKTGLEKNYNDILMGNLGKTINIANAEGRIIGEDSSQSFPAVPGRTLQTTLIKSVQKTLEKELAKLDSGCGVAMNAETGDIYAIASCPNFNADIFGTDDGADYLELLSRDKKNPFMNKVLDGLYPPGSVFKIVVALAGLESGAIRPGDKIVCTGSWQYGNHIYRCWDHDGHGPVNLIGALKHSCDVYFYQMSLKIGIEAIAQMAKKLGLGDKSFDNYDESEKTGIVPTREWKELNIGTGWVHGDTVITSIGQGFVLTNCMQLAVMLGAAITNFKVKPRITYDKKIIKEPVLL